MNLFEKEQQSSFCAPHMNSNLQVIGPVQLATDTKGSVILDVETLLGKKIPSQHQVHVLDKISINLPRTATSQEVLRRFKLYTLADSTFYLSGPVY